ncbi:SdpI family protein [Falsibacillus albus]|nr:SdpI family protein [Falsibacillus albus]
MNKKNKFWDLHDAIIFFICLIPIFIALIYYKDLPDSMAIHFGPSGEADNYQSKSMFLVILVLTNLGVSLLVKFSRFIDPRKQNYSKFMRAFLKTRYIIAVLLGGIGTATIYFNLGYAIDIKLIVLIGVGAVFIGLGNYMGQLRSNFFIGIRTPWTLSSEENWRKTHRLAGPLFMLCGVLFMICGFLPGEIAFKVMLGIIFLLALFTYGYSYYLFKKGI